MKKWCLSSLLCLGLVLLAACRTPAQPQPSPAQPSVQETPETAPAAEDVSQAAQSPAYAVLLQTLPEGLRESDLTLVQLPDRQQYVYAAAGQRLVLEAMAPGTDETLAETQPCEAGEKTVAAYVYEAGDIAWPPMASAVRQGMAAPEPGEQVLEWQMAEVFYRLFGSQTREALLEVAAGVS